MLSTTARKLNLKKISKMFKTIPVGATCNGENTDIKNTFQSTSDVVGVSWVGENCTVKETKAECDNQSEGALESGPKRHLGLGVAKDCDWRGGNGSENGWEDVIGSCSGLREHSANSGGVFQNL